MDPRAAHGSAPAELVDGVVAMMSEFHPAGYRAMAHGLAEADLRDVLPRIDVPTLLLYGDADRRSPLTVAEDLHAKIPASTLVVLPGAGHLANLEAAKVQRRGPRLPSANRPGGSDRQARLGQHGPTAGGPSRSPGPIGGTAMPRSAPLPVVFVPGGITPVRPSYAPLLDELDGEIQPLLKDLELYAADEPPADYSIQLEVDGLGGRWMLPGSARSTWSAYSGGGAVCLAFAAQHPDRLRSLAMFEPANVRDGGSRANERTTPSSPPT